MYMYELNQYPAKQGQYTMFILGSMVKAFEYYYITYIHNLLSVNCLTPQPSYSPASLHYTDYCRQKQIAISLVTPEGTITMFCHNIQSAPEKWHRV